MKVVGKMCCEINPSCRFSLGDQCAFGDNVKECVLFFDEGTGGFFGATAAHGGFFVVGELFALRMRDTQCCKSLF